MARSRTRVTSRNIGHRYNEVSGVVQLDADYVTDDKSTIQDELHPYPFIEQGAMTLTRTDRSRFHRVNGSFKNSTVNRWVSNDLTDYVKGTTLSHLPVPDVPLETDDALKALAFSNPNRGGSGIGQDLVDLGSIIPQGLYATGRSILERSADANLWAQFGILPLIEDVKAIFEYRRRVNQRIKEFNSLFLKGGLRRRIDLGVYTATTEDPSITLNSFIYNRSCKYTITTTVKRWAVVRWQADGWSLFDLQDQELEAEVTRILYGLDVDPTTLWEILPWTWLISWFSNIHLLQVANKGNFRVKCSGVAVMTQTETAHDFQPRSITSGYSGGYGTVVVTTKKRVIVLPSATAHISWNSLSRSFSRTSILASLGIQRFSKGKWIDAAGKLWDKHKHHLLEL